MTSAGHPTNWAGIVSHDDLGGNRPGNRDDSRPDGRAAGVRLSAPAAAPLAIADVEILQAGFEHAGSGGRTFLPAGLVPTSPTLVTLLTVRAPDGPHGGFTFAQVRVSCRSGARARALAVATAVDAEPAAAEWLAAGWGLGGVSADVSLDRRYDRVTAACPWFDVAVTGLAPIGLGDVQFVTGLHPVTTADGPRLAQVELDVALQRVERGHPRLARFTAPEGAVGLAPTAPVAATAAVGTLTLPALRFVLHPDHQPDVGTERVDLRSLQSG